MLAVEIDKYEFFKEFSTRSPGVWTNEGTNLVYDWLEEVNGDGAIISPHDEEMGFMEYETLASFNNDFMTDFAVPEDAKYHDYVIGITSEGHIITRSE